MIVCALDTLMRLSNVAGLERRHDHGAYLEVLNPKVRGYKVPVSSRLRIALDDLPKQKSPFYFPSVQRSSEDLRRCVVVKTFKRLCDKAGLQTGRKTGGISFHCLRHTGASRMLARGVDVKTVMELGGWKNLAVLERYLHPTDEQKRAAVERVSAQR